MQPICNSWNLANPWSCSTSLLKAILGLINHLLRQIVTISLLHLPTNLVGLSSRISIEHLHIICLNLIGRKCLLTINYLRSSISKHIRCILIGSWLLSTQNQSRFLIISYSLWIGPHVLFWILILWRWHRSTRVPSYRMIPPFTLTKCPNSVGLVVGNRSSVLKVCIPRLVNILVMKVIVYNLWRSFIIHRFIILTNASIVWRRSSQAAYRCSFLLFKLNLRFSGHSLICIHEIIMLFHLRIHFLIKSCWLWILHWLDFGEV